MTALAALNEHHAETQHNLGTYALAKVGALSAAMVGVPQQQLSRHQQAELRQLISSALRRLENAHVLMPTKLVTLEALHEVYTLTKHTEQADALEPEIEEMRARFGPSGY